MYYSAKVKFPTIYTHIDIHTYIHTYIHTNIHTYIHTYIYTVSEITELTLQFATQNCLGYYLKLNLGGKFHAEVATHFPHVKLITLHALDIIL